MFHRPHLREIHETGFYLTLFGEIDNEAITRDALRADRVEKKVSLFFYYYYGS